MLCDIVKKGSTSRSVPFRVLDATTGVPVTSYAFNTAGVDFWYKREGGLRVAVTEVTLAAANTAWTSGGLIHVSDGYGRLDLPDAAFASGANYVDFGGTFTGMVVTGGRIRLADFDIETATQAVNVTQFGGSAGVFASGRPEVNYTHLAGVALLTGTAQSGSANSMRGQSGQSAYPGDVIWSLGGATPARVCGTITAVSGNGTSAPDWTVGGGFNGTAPGSGTNYVILPKDGLVPVDASLLATAAQAIAVLARLPALLVGGRMDVSIGAYQTGLIPLMPAVQGRTLNVDASGVADANLSKFRGAVSQGTGAPGDNIRPVGIDPS